MERETVHLASQEQHLISGVLSVAAIAADVFHDLEHPLPQRPATPRAWHLYDDLALIDLAEMRLRTPEAAHELSSQPEALATFTNLLGNLHRALPFSVIERNWLCDTCYEDYDDRAAKEIALPWSSLSGAIRGGDVLRRWWAWRRQVDEFQASSSLESAKVALHGLWTTFRSASPSD
jgi:hypothetical protein